MADNDIKKLSQAQQDEQRLEVLKARYAEAIGPGDLELSVLGAAKDEAETLWKEGEEIKLEKALVESLVLDELGIVIGQDRTQSIRDNLRKLRSGGR